MIDFHSHILYGIDDGSSDIEESIEIIKKMRTLGFDKIILTPHYIEDSKYSANNKIKNELKNNLDNQNLGIELYVANEIFINENIDKLVYKQEISTINNTSYVLVELPFEEELPELDDILDDLLQENFKVIIAHPERYVYFRNNRNRVVELSNQGIYFQCNYESIIGKYGADAQNMVKYMFHANLVSFLGSDIHRKNSAFFNNFNTIKKEIIKIIGEDKFNKITNENPNKVLKNSILPIPEYNSPTKSNFLKGIINKLGHGSEL